MERSWPSTLKRTGAAARCFPKTRCLLCQRALDGRRHAGARHRGHRRRRASSSPMSAASIPTSPATPTAPMSRRPAFPLSGCRSRRSRNTTSAGSGRDSAYAAQFPDQHGGAGHADPDAERGLRPRAQIRRPATCASTSRPRSIPTIPRSPPTRSASSTCCSISLAAEKFSDRVMVQSFDWRTLQLVQKLRARDPDGLSHPAEGQSRHRISWTRPTEWTAGFDPAGHGGSLPRTIKAAGGAIWSPYFGDVDAGADLRIPRPRASRSWSGPSTSRTTSRA